MVSSPGHESLKAAGAAEWGAEASSVQDRAAKAAVHSLHEMVSFPRRYVRSHWFRVCVSGFRASSIVQRNSLAPSHDHKRHCAWQAAVVLAASESGIAKFSPFSCPIFLGHPKARGRCSQGERVLYGRDLWRSGGTGKAEHAKLPGAGIGPKQCPEK